MAKSFLARKASQQRVFVKLDADARGSTREDAPMVEGFSTQRETDG